MQTDDFVGLIAGGRGSKKRLLRPLLRGLFERGQSGEASEVVEQTATEVAQTFKKSGGSIISSVRRFVFRDGKEQGEAEEVLEEADNESAIEEAGGCCRCITADGGFKIHFLFFMFTFAITLNWTATGYAIGRKVCLSQNASTADHKIAEEFCQRWLHSPNVTLHSEPHSIEAVINGLFGLAPAAVTGQTAASNLSALINSSTVNERESDQWSRHHHRKPHRGGEAEETAQLYVIYQAIVALVPPALVMIIVILSYRDEFEDFKKPLIFGMFGTLLSTAANLASSRFPYSPLFYDILTPLGEMLCGGLPIVMTCVYVHIATSVQPKGRTTAFFLLQVSFLLSFSIARLVSALVVDAHLVTLPLFIASLIVLAITMIFVVVYVGHVDLTAEEGRRRRHGGSHRSTSTTNPVLLSSRLFSHHHLLHSVRGLVREQANGTKYELLFVMATVFFLVATTNASVSGFFLENTNQRGVVLDSVVVIATVLIVLPIFVIIVRKLPFDPNYTVTFIGVFFLTAGQSLHLASMGGGENSAAMNHIQHVLRTLSNLAPAGMRAHVATLVDRRRFGKAFAAVAACEAVAPLIGSAMHRLIGRGFGQLPLLLLLWGPLLILGFSQCRRRQGEATAVADEDE